MQKSSRKIYWNPKQIAFLQARQQYKTFLAGRAAGKSTVIAGQMYMRIRELPRGKIFLSSTTYNQILTKTLPAIEGKLNEFGLKEGKHYVVGKKPPAHFALPYQPPRKYENILSLWQGSAIEYLSLDRPDLARGGSYCAGDVDEAALVDKEHYTKVLLPSVRGFRHKFTSDLYRNVNLYTSIPWKPSGYWILDFEEKAKANPDMYAFIEASAWDNVEVLGEDYLKGLEAELPYLEYLVEVLNKRIKRAERPFYHRFNPDIHGYTVQYLYGEGDRGIITNGVADPNYNPKELLDISFDFSGWFNCASAWQGRKAGGRQYEFCLHQFFVKAEEGKIAELCDTITSHYAKHEAKLVRIWGEPRGHDPKADTTETLYSQIKRHFEAKGWRVEIRVGKIQEKQHKERNTLMNEILSEANPHLPIMRWNEITCKDYMIAMQVTKVTEDYKKDKGKERDRMFAQEHAPHFTDTGDYYISQKYGLRAKQGMRPAMSAYSR
jgi:hypothetical protein